MVVYAHHKLTGVSHENKSTRCQDSFAYKDIGIAVIAAVADGVGSEEHSEFGSKTASETAVLYCAENIQSSMKADDILGVIYQSFDQAWCAVEQGANEKQYDIRQCNTTLSLIVFISGDVYYGHVGDSGIFAFFEDGKIEPVTTPQNDPEGRVFTLSSGPNKWEFDKTRAKVCSLLLCTDGVWNMFHPDRLALEHEKHSVPLLAWYIDPEAIKVHSKHGGIQKWLEADMNEINSKSPNNVSYDDITIVIIHCDKIRHNRQPEYYYRPPSKTELEQAKEAEHKRLYGHLGEKRETYKRSEVGVATTKELQIYGQMVALGGTRTSEIPLGKACEYDKSYCLSIEDRTILTKKIFEKILKENKPPWWFPFKSGRDQYPYNIYVVKDVTPAKLDIRFDELRGEENKTYYHIIEQAAKLLTNGLSLFHSKDNLSITYRISENKRGFGEELLNKELSDLFKVSYFDYRIKKESAVLPSPNEWLMAINRYLSMLKDSGCKKPGHWSIYSNCPWCVVDKAWQEGTT